MLRTPVRSSPVYLRGSFDESRQTQAIRSTRGVPGRRARLLAQRETERDSRGV